MTVELTMLTYSVGLLVFIIVIQASSGILTHGIVALAGSRDQLGEPGLFEARSKRVVDNHREGMLIFAPLVLVASIADISTSTTVLGAQLFFYSRVVHAGLYLTGVPWLRPAAWAVGLFGCGMIFVELIRV